MRAIVAAAAVFAATASGCAAAPGYAARTQAASLRPARAPSGPARAPGPKVLTFASGLPDPGGRRVVISVRQRLILDLRGDMYRPAIGDTRVLRLMKTSGGYPPGGTPLRADLLALAPGVTTVRTSTDGMCSNDPGCEVPSIAWSVTVVVQRQGAPRRGGRSSG